MVDELPTISSEVVHENPWFALRRDEYRLPSGKVRDYHYVRSTGSVFVVPVLEDGRLVLVKQYRYLNQRISIEFPGGGVGRNREPLDAALAELAEEAGVTGALKKLGQFNPCNGLIDEICTVYLATELERTDAGEPDEAEEIEVVYATPSELESWIRDGVVWDGMTLAAFSLYRIHQPAFHQS